MAVQSLHRCYAAFMITCCRISGLKKLTDRVCTVRGVLKEILLKRERKFRTYNKKK